MVLEAMGELNAQPRGVCLAKNKTPDVIFSGLARITV
jgi:hypothetical protein